MPKYVVRIAAQHHLAFVPFDPDTVDLHILRPANGWSERIDAPSFAPVRPGPLSAIGEQSASFLEISREQLEYFEFQFQALFEQVRELL